MKNIYKQIIFITMLFFTSTLSNYAQVKSIPSDVTVKRVIKNTIEKENADKSWIADTVMDVRKTLVKEVIIINKSDKIDESYAMEEILKNGKIGSQYSFDKDVYSKEEIAKLKKNGWRITKIGIFNVTAKLKGICEIKLSNEIWQKTNFEKEIKFALRKWGNKEWDCVNWD